MNPGLPTRASVKSSGISQTLDYHFDLTTSVPVSPLITWFEVIGYTVLLDSPTVSRQHQIEHSNKTEVVLPVRLCSALQRINPRLSSEAIAQAIRKVTSLESLNLLSNNRHFHKLLTTGVDVTYQFNGQTVQENVSLVDQSNLLNNDWLVINPFPVLKGTCTHSLDVVVFVNGLPLAVMVWIDPQDENATLKAAYQRLQTYLQKIPQLFIYNAFLIIACGNRARVGTLTSDWQEFLPWRTIDGEDFPCAGETQLEVLIQGIFDKRRFLELVKSFIVFEENTDFISKKFLRYPFCTTMYPPI